MSRGEESVGFTIAEKFFALLIILIGSIVVINTMSSADLQFPIFFIVGGLAFIMIGVIMILAKTY
ncbi:MAG: hypothetical protein JSV05_00720 [Candidatus Bathyarchaeota archaeon]|nr:MAG: hypothetical protein JSV05_00720 [Candidatus Bathyarchaeota archaeon]